MIKVTNMELTRENYVLTRENKANIVRKLKTNKADWDEVTSAMDALLVAKRRLRRHIEADISGRRHFIEHQ